MSFPRQKSVHNKSLILLEKSLSDEMSGDFDADLDAGGIRGDFRNELQHQISPLRSISCCACPSLIVTLSFPLSFTAAVSIARHASTPSHCILVTSALAAYLYRFRLVSAFRFATL